MNRTAPRRSIGTRLVVTAGVGAAVVLATPGTAAATDPVVPLVSCVTAVENGYWTAVFGYTNRTSVTQRQPIGYDNDFDPDRFNGPQAETFQPGTHNGVFSVRVPSAYSSIEWELYDTRVTARRDSSTACPPSTALPADGNGLGTTMVFLGAGAAAAVSMQVARRRRRRSAAPSMG